MRDKGGTMEIDAIPVMIIFIVILAVIAVNTTIFYSANINVDKKDSEILNERIISCFNKNEINTLVGASEKIAEGCNLDLDKLKTNKYYINITLGFGVEEENLQIGNPDIVLQCKLKEDSKAKNFGSCTHTRAYASSGQILIVTTGVNNAYRK